MDEISFSMETTNDNKVNMQPNFFVRPSSASQRSLTLLPAASADDKHTVAGPGECDYGGKEKERNTHSDLHGLSVARIQKSTINRMVIGMASQIKISYFTSSPIVSQLSLSVPATI